LGILAIEILGIWFLISVVAGLALGAKIRNGERNRQDEVFVCLFSKIEARQASR